MIRPFGEAAFLIELGETARVHAVAEALQRRPRPGLRECVPGLETLLVEFDPLQIDPAAVEAAIREAVEAEAGTRTGTGRHRSIPVVYGGEFGPDLGEVARHVGSTPTEVIERHATSRLTVRICGFAPGFAYLGDLPPELDVPRLATPRTRTPAGAVGIAGSQTGIYPAELPGGWRIIGRSPITVFDAERQPPAYLAPGDSVQFRPIDATEWEAYRGAPHDW